MSKPRPEEIHIKKLMEELAVKDIMNTSFATIREGGTLSEVQLKFIAHRTFYVAVVNDDEQLVGLISQKYLFKTQSPRKLVNQEMQFQAGIIADGDSFYNKDTLNSFRLRNVMNNHPTTLSPESSVAEAIAVMKKRNIGCVVIVNKSRIIQGILTSQEIVNYLADVLNF